jgi:hypothetical protein
VYQLKLPGLCTTLFLFSKLQFQQPTRIFSLLLNQDLKKSSLRIREPLSVPYSSFCQSWKTGAGLPDGIFSNQKSQFG